MKKNQIEESKEKDEISYPSCEKSEAKFLSRNIHERMLAVTNDLQGVTKDGVNTFQNYKYVKASDIVQAVKPLLVKHGINLVITQELYSRSKDVSKETVDQHGNKTSEYGKNFISELTQIARFVNVDNPTDKVEVVYTGIGHDTGDKDIYKAKTGGLKYLFIEQFKIDTDMEDPEYSKEAKESPLANNTKSSLTPSTAVSAPSFRGKPATLKEPTEKKLF